MGFDLFKHERRVLADGRARAGGDADADAGAFAALLDEYEKLLKETRRLVRLNDRNENALRDAKARIEEALAELQRTQAELVEAEKLAALGGLVAGVAHEVNTPLGIVLTAATALTAETRRLEAMARDGQAKKSDVYRYFEGADQTVTLIHQNAERAARLVESFKHVAVDQTSDQRRQFDMAGYAREVVASLHPEIRKTPHEVTVAGDPGVVVDSYPGAVAQVLTNLVMNALAHAFDEGAPGRVRVEIEGDGEQAVLRCIDDGRGIPPEHRGRVFEPFYTTRRGAGGSGLGLHVVHNLVTSRLHGRIGVDDTPGGGATFTVAFPLRAPTEDGGASTDGDGMNGE